jgi:Flp pilus assembly protein TadG
VNKILKRAQNFGRDSRGNFAMMFALSAVPLLLGGAMAIDVSRMYLVQSKMTAAIDAAVLATTQGLTQGTILEADAEAAVLAFVEANLDGRNIKSGEVVIDSIVVDPVKKTVAVDAHSLMAMTMGGLVGYDHQRIDAFTKAAYSDTEIEVVMALDLTGSMDSRIGGWGTPKKIDSLKTAAKNAITTIFDTPDAIERVRVGIAPYSAGVNIGSYKSSVALTNSSNGCVYERTGTEKYSDAAPGTSAKIGGTTSSICPSAKIQPLTTNESALNTLIDSMGTGGCTAGEVGIAWTYYMLSPNWTGVWPDASDPAAYSATGTRKYAIIMTDGMFNYAHSSSSSCNQQSKAETYAKNLCSSMKASGIRVYTIAFDAPSDAQTLLQNCASTNTGTIQYYFSATDEAELDDAFNTIALDIQGLRLVN